MFRFSQTACSIPAWSSYSPKASVNLVVPSHFKNLMPLQRVLKTRCSDSPTDRLLCHLAARGHEVRTLTSDPGICRKLPRDTCVPRDNHLFSQRM